MVGFIQIAVFLLGLALICMGGYVGLSALWGNEQRSILADIGSRLVGTGYVIAVFTGMADIFGLGSQPLPNVPYFGPWQAGGVLIGQAIIALGLLMIIPYRFDLKKLREQMLEPPSLARPPCRSQRQVLRGRRQSFRIGRSG